MEIKRQQDSNEFLYFVPVILLLYELNHDTLYQNFSFKRGRVASLWGDVHGRRLDGSSML